MSKVSSEFLLLTAVVPSVGPILDFALPPVEVGSSVFLLENPLSWDGLLSSDSVFLSRLAVVARTCLRQFVWIAVPIAVFAIIFHMFEAIVQRRLVERFGWKAALWTGWIGTPIHESSHALMCWVFGHQIESMALFEPDSREGRLGYVRHTYQRGDWWQESGNFFIGLAPLAGGTLALLLLTWLMFPGLVEQFLEASHQFSANPSVSTLTGSSEIGSIETNAMPAADAVAPSGLNRSAAISPDSPLTELTEPAEPSLTWWSLLASTLFAFGQLLTPANLLTWRFWLFMYLTLCITCHMAPSASDYHGARKGGLLLLVFWLLLNFCYGMLGMSMEVWTQALAPLWQLMFAMLLLAVALGGIVAVLIYGLTAIWDQILQLVYRRRA